MQHNDLPIGAIQYNDKTLVEIDEYRLSAQSAMPNGQILVSISPFSVVVMSVGDWIVKHKSGMLTVVPDIPFNQFVRMNIPEERIVSGVEPLSPMPTPSAQPPWLTLDQPATKPVLPEHVVSLAREILVQQTVHGGYDVEKTVATCINTAKLFYKALKDYEVK